MNRLMQENYALILGITLPLALMIIFFIAGRTAEVTTADPLHDLVYVADYYEGANQPYNIGIDNGKIEIRFRPQGEKEPYYNNTPRIYVFDHTALTARPVDIDFKNIVDGKVVDPDLDALNRKTLSTAAESPDGYRFEYNSRSSGGGIAGEFFGFGRSYNGNYALAKGPRTIPLKGDQPAYQAKFLAWVTGDAP
ncbi:MAG: hypothetical protein HYU57_01870 [Micavibrio aeruginosavorus]|nr:hypothetical protein [Micavibrio aeruginosavorus]